MRRVRDRCRWSGGTRLTPVLDLLAGMLGGALMAMTWLGYAAMVFTFDPPEAIKQRIESGKSASTTMAIAMGTLLGFVVVGCGAGLVADAAMGGIGGRLSLVPSGLYAAMTITVAIVAAVPLIGFMHDKLTHLAVWVALAVGIYGVLIPNLVVALQNRM